MDSSAVVLEVGGFDRRGLGGKLHSPTKSPENRNAGKIKILNFNNQGLTNKQTHLEELLLVHHPDVEIACITEHWFTHENVGVFNIQKFNVASHFARATHTHGGVMILVKQHLAFERIDLSQFCLEFHVEICGVYLRRQNLIVLALYRSPTPTGDIHVFFDLLDDALGFIRAEYGGDIVIAGDYNIDYLEPTRHPEHKKMLDDFAVSHRFSVVVKEPTRIVRGSESCLDNILTSIQLHRLHIEIINPHLSDHLGVVLDISLDCCRGLKPGFHCYSNRNINAENTYRFRLRLSLIDWESMLTDGNVNVSYARFHETLVCLFDTIFPVTIKRRHLDGSTHQRTSEEAKEFKRMLDALWVIARVRGDVESFEAYQTLKTHYKRLVSDDRR